MRQRRADQLGLTLEEYEAQVRPHARDHRAAAASAAKDRYRYHRRLRASVNRTAERARAYYEDYYARNKDKFYRAAYKRRALIKSVEHEHIERHDVFARDGWRCRICNVRVRDDVKRGHPRKAILGHIVAIASGGPHTWDNVCCLCHDCNTKDGVNQLPIQKTFCFEGAS